MQKYSFLNEKVGFSEDGVHLLRNKYCYKKISFEQVEYLTIEEGRYVNNWILILVIGLIMGISSLIICFMMIRSLIMVESSPRQANFVGHMLLAGLILGGMGFYSILGVLKKVPIMIVFDGIKKHRVQLDVMENQLKQLIDFLNKKHVLINSSIFLLNRH